MLKTFAGWYDSLEGTNLIAEDFTVTKEDDHTIYAYWIDTNGENSNLLNVDKSIFTYDETLGYYCISSEVLSNIDGILNVDASLVSSFTYFIKDNVNNTIKEGSIEIAENWSIQDVGFVMGVNTLEVKAELNNGTSVKDAVYILSTTYVNLETLDLDTADNDNDGLNNHLENYYGTNSENPDSDGDGLGDEMELAILSTDPNKVDTNDNGVNDADEDADGDGLSNSDELIAGTDPAIIDSDIDGLSD